jgi:hypothetical protein
MPTGRPHFNDKSGLDHNRPATDPASAAYGALLMARMLIQQEIASVGESYGLADALTLTEDAISQIRGELASRQPERPIWQVQP